MHLVSSTLFYIRPLMFCGFFSCCITLAKISSTLLNKGTKSHHPWHVLGLKRHILFLFALYDVGYWFVISDFYYVWEWLFWHLRDCSVIKSAFWALGSWEYENQPCPSSPAAHRRANPVPCQGSTLEITLLSGSQASQPWGCENRRDDQPLICHVQQWRERNLHRT